MRILGIRDKNQANEDKVLLDRNMNQRKTLADIIDFNPLRIIKRGELKPFIDMAAVQADYRDITEFVYREFKG